MGKLVDAFEDWVDNGHMTRGESLGEFYRRFCRQYEAEHPTCGATREQVERLKAREVADLTDIEGALDGEDTLGATIRRLREENERLKAQPLSDEAVTAIARATLRAAAETTDAGLNTGVYATWAERGIDAALAEAAKWGPQFQAGQKVRIMSMPERVWEIMDVPLVAVHVVRPDDPGRGQLLIPLGDLLEWPLPPEPEEEP